MEVGVGLQLTLQPDLFLRGLSENSNSPNVKHLAFSPVGRFPEAGLHFQNVKMNFAGVHKVARPLLAANHTTTTESLQFRGACRADLHWQSEGCVA